MTLRTFVASNTDWGERRDGQSRLIWPTFPQRKQAPVRRARSRSIGAGPVEDVVGGATAGMGEVGGRANRRTFAAGFADADAD